MANRHPWKKSAVQLAMIETGGEIGDADFYPTPAWCTEALLATCPPPDGLRIIEPAAGTGAIVRVLLEAGRQVHAVEVRPRALPFLRELCPSTWGNWISICSGANLVSLEETCGGPPAECAIVTNPPFSIAQDFTAATVGLLDVPWVGMLLRLNALGSKGWRDLWRLHPPSTLLPLSRRPSFTPDGKTSMDTTAGSSGTATARRSTSDRWAKEKIMFAKQYPCRIRSLYLGQRHAKDEEDHAFALVVLQYDFTEDLASAIGGAAVGLQSMLAQGDDGVKVSRAGLVLDVRDVSMTLKSADKDELKIASTERLKAKGRNPNAEDTGPTLEVGAAFAIEDDAPLAFFRAHLGELVKVRMDRRQLEIPTGEGE